MFKFDLLRFRGFDDEWNEFKLGDISDSITKGTTPKKYSENGINFIKVESITNNKITEIDAFIDENTHNNELNRSKLEKNDLLFSIAGSLGRTTIITEDILPANTNQALSIIRFDKHFDMNLNFIQSRLNTYDIDKYIFQNLAVGAQPNLNLQQVKNIKIRLPVLEEQNKIQNFLDNIDKKIELLEKKHKYYQDFKKYLMQQIFTGKLRFDFVEVKLKDISKINKGEQLNKDVMIEDGKYYVLNGGKDPSGYTNEWNVSENTITISEGGNSCGYVNFNTEKFWSGGHCYYLSNLDENVDDYYLYNYLKFKEKFIMHLRVGSGLPNIQKRDIENIKIQIISKNNQNKISNLFLFVDKKINSIQIQKENFENFKKGLLQQMFV